MWIQHFPSASVAFWFWQLPYFLLHRLVLLERWSIETVCRCFLLFAARSSCCCTYFWLQSIDLVLCIMPKKWDYLLVKYFENINILQGRKAKRFHCYRHYYQDVLRGCLVQLHNGLLQLATYLLSEDIARHSWNCCAECCEQKQWGFDRKISQSSQSCKTGQQVIWTYILSSNDWERRFRQQKTHYS